jgi:hypothetical protein
MRETWIDQHAVYLVCHSLPLRSFARYVARYLTYAIMPQRLAEEADVITGEAEAAVSFSVGLIIYPHVSSSSLPSRARLCLCVLSLDSRYGLKVL